MISIIFEDGVSWRRRATQVARRLAEARDALPAGVTPALAPDAAATGQIFWYTVEGAGYDLARLRAVQDWYVRPQLVPLPAWRRLPASAATSANTPSKSTRAACNALGVQLSRRAAGRDAAPMPPSAAA